MPGFLAAKRWLVCLGVCLLLPACKKAAPEEQKREPPEVTVAVPVVRPVTPYEEFTGTTEAIDSVDVRARVSGYLVDVCFEPGEEVTKDKVLFKIDSSTYDAALEKAKGEVTAYEARVARLTAEAERAERLIKSKTISQEEYERAQFDLGEAKGGLAAALGARKRAAVEVEYTDVKARIAGRTGRNLISIGNVVMADSTLLTTIVAVEKMYVYFDVDERRFLRLQALANEQEAARAKKEDAKPETKPEGEDNIPVFMAIGDSKDYPYEGFLNFAEARVNPETGTKQVRGEFDNPLIGKRSRALTPGLFVRLRVPIDEPKPAVLVAEVAIGSAQGQKYVWVVDAKDVARRRMVQLGASVGQLRVIAQGLQKGERVVVNGLQKVREDAPVTPQEGKMPGDEPAAEKAAPQS